MWLYSYKLITNTILLYSSCSSCELSFVNLLIRLEVSTITKCSPKKPLLPWMLKQFHLNQRLNLGLCQWSQSLSLWVLMRCLMVKFSLERSMCHHTGSHLSRKHWWKSTLQYMSKWRLTFEWYYTSNCNECYSWGWKFSELFWCTTYESFREASSSGNILHWKAWKWLLLLLHWPWFCKIYFRSCHLLDKQLKRQRKMLLFYFLSNKFSISISKKKKFILFYYYYFLRLVSFYVKMFWIKKKIKWVSGRLWISKDNIFG